MASVPPKKMLEQILRAGALSAKDREIFEGMWDAIHRYGGLSKKQVSWIEDVFYKLPKAGAPQAGPKRSPKRAVVQAPAIWEAFKVYSFEQFQGKCPDATPTVVARVKHFFNSGGEVLEVKPSEPNGPPKASKA